ncbi:MAG TPA: RnfABCDGE type electron transport complex subunit B [Nevskiaceae bacterium]|nr:RnfABCDGE type electron transport complex subunit B [Nevskiaceae bacterium]
MSSAAATPLADRIDALLPQTQCTRCGYPDCRSYAEAIAGQRADFNQCPPGGDEGIAQLSALLGRAPKPLNPANGIAQVVAPVAVIDEARCIGCTLCIQACPVDAISGANLLMHTVIAAACTGCELCIPPCPVDCISLETPPVTPPAWTYMRMAADEQRARYYARNARNARERQQQLDARARRKAMLRARAASSDPSEAPHEHDPLTSALARERGR